MTLTALDHSGFPRYEAVYRIHNIVAPHIRKESMIMRFRSIVAATLLMATSTATHAYTECTGNITRIWTDGTTWVWFDTGLIWGLWPADDETGANGASRSKNILALATTAMISGKSVTVRFVNDGVSCTGQQTQNKVWGMYLNAT